MSDNFPIDAIQGMINRLEDRFDERFNKIDDRLEKMDDKIDEVSKTADKNTVVLEEHQRRALANEKHSHLLEQQMKAERADAANALEEHDKKQELKVKQLADSVELFTKLPKYLYKVAIWLAAISAGGTALYAILRFAFSYVS